MKIFGLGLVLAAVLGLACAGPGKSDGPRPDGSGASSDGHVAPNTYLTFEGQRYLLVGTLQADLPHAADFRRLGDAERADIDFEGSLGVYVRAGDREAVYTSSRDGGGGGRAPAVWLRWVQAPPANAGAYISRDRAMEAALRGPVPSLEPARAVLHEKYRLDGRGEVREAPVWLVELVTVAEKRLALRVLVDARTGEVLMVSNPPGGQ